MNPSETLRPRFYQGQELAVRLRDSADVYAVGNYVGQLEKLTIGACRFCMFRPNGDDRDLMGGVIHALASRFGLVVRTLDFFNHAGPTVEFWVCRPDDEQEFHDLEQLAVNAPEWHRKRASMCGVNPDWVDDSYHERPGHDPKE